MSRTDTLGLRASNLGHLNFNQTDFLTDNDVIAPESPTKLGSKTRKFQCVCITLTGFSWLVLAVLNIVLLIQINTPTEPSLIRYITFWKGKQQSSHLCEIDEEDNSYRLRLIKDEIFQYTNEINNGLNVIENEMRCDGMYFLRFVAQWNSSEPSCKIKLCRQEKCEDITPKTGSWVHAELYLSLTKEAPPRVEVPANCLLCVNPNHHLMTAEFMETKCL